MSDAPATGPAPAVSLVIAVLTFRRPADIMAALPMLVAQAETVRTADFRVSVCVIDNDAGESARDPVLEFAARSPVPVRYAAEPEPGISAARNRALAEAEGEGDDLLVFIDDDERPTAGWLRSLLDVHRERGCAAVVGPVISEYETYPESWIEAGEFFVRRRMPTGSRLEVAATNNLLLDLRQVRQHGLTFDPAFGIGGGGDTLFTRTLHKLGGEMVWCDEAVVIDVVPTSRLTRSWVTRRAFRSGNSWSLTSLALCDSGSERIAVRVRSTLQGLVRLLGGLARLVIGLLTRSLGQRARGVRTVARGAGMISGAWGYSYLEYRRPG